MAVYAEKLRVAELRVTRPRVGILWAVQANPHADTETIFGVVRAALPEVSRQTVYDVLHALTDVGLLRRFQPSGSVARYETRVGDNHHHTVCRSCGAIADVDCAVGEVPCLIASDDCGFLLEETEVIYWGLCPACLGSSTAGGSAPADRAWTGDDHIYDYDLDVPPDDVTLCDGNPHSLQQPARNPSGGAAPSHPGNAGIPSREAATMQGGPSGPA